ncbi:hypothetical protein ACIQYG_22455 [Peribacillus sp. NPDC096622]|uniref:hypothetical protein n=1 Tax=Peribacillus sp. NPDC096622 TaxID=3364396 RepID=UPI003828A284
MLAIHGSRDQLEMITLNQLVPQTVKVLYWERLLHLEIHITVEIRHISSTNENNYIYRTGNYELQFNVGEDQTVVVLFESYIRQCRG